MAVETNITKGQWFIGSDLVLRFNIKQEDLITPQDMTGWTLSFVLREKTQDGTIKISKTTSSGIALANGSGTNDRANVTIQRADTLALREGIYWYALWRSDDPNDTVLAYGSAYLTKAAIQVV